MNRWLSRVLRLGAGLAVLGVVWSCNAPFIPVPPPSQASFMSALVSDGQGGQKTVWTAAGTVGATANGHRVFVFNEANGSGVITRADAAGAYQSPPFDGAMGDHIDISYEDSSGELSATACLLLQEGAQAPKCPEQ